MQPRHRHLDKLEQVSLSRLDQQIQRTSLERRTHSEVDCYKWGRQIDLFGLDYLKSV